jgi:hypothetical protein
MSRTSSEHHRAGSPVTNLLVERSRGRLGAADVALRAMSARPGVARSASWSTLTSGGPVTPTSGAGGLSADPCGCHGEGFGKVAFDVVAGTESDQMGPPG